jgi:hypothetical protein
VLGRIDVAEVMVAAVDQLGTIGQLAVGQGGGRARDQDLAAMADRQQTGDPVERRPEDVLVALWAVPVWSAIRIRSGPSGPMRSAALARWPSIAAPVASLGCAKRARIPSPVVLMTRP